MQNSIDFFIFLIDPMGLVEVNAKSIWEPGC